ncbi:MAG: histidinol dehydrogenase [Alphaproteobacteria bacterium]|jgi:histidinol dehydrogenase|nr:histidinol dehydrogenase [Alphaproteobacteria bacterium]MBT4019771.1 histidinol dehydrogenase [Alphaproteobacteria bacterium]MBT5158169.1 histidinol dehydrogenase [Alphaproteobacteria bacterium]MBT5919502.1 histidinol dehydrogenase [Alphaproteobacteria bacterium]MBT6387845.1 histidinol dehydrogenase [Alphaproteobacteria bacterium]
MPLRLSTKDASFEAAFTELLGQKREASVDVNQTVTAIINDVRARGDVAVAELTAKFDRLDVTPQTLAISKAEIEAAMFTVSEDDLAALKVAAKRIEDFHGRQVPQGESHVDAQGVETGYRWTAVQSVGLYVPGGKAAYPSSVLMNAIPARAAGVKRIVMVVPTPDGILHPLVLAAAHVAGIDEIYRIGGAQAVAALAYGTDTIKPVDKIVGPGNAYVAAAKRQVFGIVGIDMIAGPSEILVVADNQNDPKWIAADLLSQAEHDEDAQAILITDDADYADEVEVAVQDTLKNLNRHDVAAASWRDYGAIIVSNDFSEAAGLVDRVAPEHLELAVEDADGLSKLISNAGAIFLGRYTPEAIGDYVAGPSHVLPTSRSARFSSGLSVLDFMKRTSLIRCDADSVQRIGGAAVTLAEAEGFGAHALSVALRLGHNPG